MYGKEEIRDIRDIRKYEEKYENQQIDLKLENLINRLDD